MKRPAWQRRLINGAILLGFLVASGLVEHSAQRVRPEAGMPVRGVVGKPVSGRDLTATVQQAVTTPQLLAAGKTVTTTGRWLVITAQATAPLDNSTPLNGARLMINGAEYSPTERADGTLAGASLETAIPITGQLIFEIPADALAAARSTQLELSYQADNRLDSILQIPLPPADLRHRASVDVTPLQWGER